MAGRGGGELRPLCASLDGLACVEPTRLARWLGKLVASLSKRPDDAESSESRALLRSLTAYLMCENSDNGGTLTGLGGDLLSLESLGAAHGGLMTARATLAPHVHEDSNVFVFVFKFVFAPTTILTKIAHNDEDDLNRLHLKL